MADQIDSSMKEELRKIAQNAINSINEITKVIDNPRANVSPVPASGNSSLNELQRRFPTAAAAAQRSRSTSGRYQPTSTSTRVRPYPAPQNNTRRSRSAGRPLASDTVTRDVVVVKMASDRIPTKTEKVELEKNGRVVTGFDINRYWDARLLEKELATLLCGSLEGVGFEIMKNSSGTLLRPNIPTGKKIDAKLLLKSIAPSGCIYLRPLYELKREPADDMFPEDDLSQVSEHTDIFILPTSTPPPVVPVTNVNTSEVVLYSRSYQQCC